MKTFKEYVTETEQNLARDLNEFAPGGNDSNSPYAYGVAIQKFADLYADSNSDISADGVDIEYDNDEDSISQKESDAADIDRIAKAFLSKGMEAGREAYMSIDDFIQDDITGYLEDQGFNVANDIYAEYKKDMERWDNSPEGKVAARTQQEKDAEWEKGKADRDANEVVISAVNPKNPYDVQSSVLFDQRRVPAGQLRSKIEQAVANIKKELPARSADSVIQVTIGGKPINIEQDIAEKLGDNRPKLGTARDQGKSVRKWRKASGLDESTELSSILKNAGLKD
jgi:hypothetical protein